MKIPAWSANEGARRARELFAGAFPELDGPDGVWASPGRINLIGEHVDYNGGICLPVALPHRTYVALRRREDTRLRLVSDESGAARWEGELSSVHPEAEIPAWVAYAAGVAWALQRKGHALGGFDAAVVSCVPLGAGLSSSAALECAMGLALDEVYGLGLATSPAVRAELVAACVSAENDVVGAPTGGMDQAASLLTTKDHALQLDCLTGATTQVPFDLAAQGLTILVIDTQAKHSLVDGQYGQRRAVCERVAALEGVETLRQLPDPQGTLSRLNDPEAVRRVRHVVTEIERTQEFVELLTEGEYGELGALMNASHASLRDDYEVSCAELDTAVEAARAAGAWGARMTGGGFGGSAIALIEQGNLEATMAAVDRAFVDNGWIAPRFLEATASEAGRRINEEEEAL
ncbi:galactokinase [Actinobaculum sp. 313]|uniref:galactokinase n=1 Tax=Actinobaculum sp. 313 TaxID=2495645 RepID=UPI000D52596E|nr:galactokinase [Actinobaculum sp. 313]AWE43300.1 galactokinase [Actinobaculum sp. 313]